MSLAAIEGIDPQFFERPQTIQNDTQLLVHQAKEDPPHEETEAREGRHGRVLEVVHAPRNFQLSAFLEDSAGGQRLTGDYNNVCYNLF